MFGRIDPKVIKDNDEVELITDPTDGLQSRDILLTTG